MLQMGNRIRQLRTTKGVTQEELGKLVGVRRAAVNKWETGETKNLKRDVIQRLSEYFGVSASYLMGMTDIPNTDVFHTKRVPVLGSIAAGEPILATEEYCEYAEVGDNMKVDFCLRVTGDSMIDARICDGDLVFVRKQPIVENGEIAVVLIDDEATLKRFYRNENMVILKAENSQYPPMFYTEADFQDVRILGKAVMFQSLL